MKMNTYVNYGGNCEQALRFYEKHLAGKILTMSTYSDMPNAPKGMEGKILHARIEIGGTTLMASDTPLDRFQPMRSAYLCLSVENSEEAERIYALLKDGAEIFMPMEETFFASRFAMLRDKFGTFWMIIHERPMPRAS
ncbi:MAG TPA: VOC family protein [Candidatus Aquilonibacter sp.]|nr:VOC family protein [Candidatus Aquilonibacter sp.]